MILFRFALHCECCEVLCGSCLDRELVLRVYWQESFFEILLGRWEMAAELLGCGVICRMTACAAKARWRELRCLFVYTANLDVQLCCRTQQEIKKTLLTGLHTRADGMRGRASSGAARVAPRTMVRRDADSGRRGGVEKWRKLKAENPEPSSSVSGASARP